MERNIALSKPGNVPNHKVTPIILIGAYSIKPKAYSLAPALIRHLLKISLRINSYFLIRNQSYI